MINTSESFGTYFAYEYYFSGLWPKLPKLLRHCRHGPKLCRQHSARSAAQRLPARKRRYRKPAGRRLVITLHIKVGYGLNIASITQSITHRVKDEVEHATGLKVARIDVFVDDIIDE